MDFYENGLTIQKNILWTLEKYKKIFYGIEIIIFKNQI